MPSVEEILLWVRLGLRLVPVRLMPRMFGQKSLAREEIVKSKEELFLDKPLVLW